MVVNSGMLPGSWTSIRKVTKLGQASRQGAVVCTLRRDAGWLRIKDAAKGQVSRIFAMLIGEGPGLAAGYGRSPEKIVNVGLDAEMPRTAARR